MVQTQGNTYERGDRFIWPYPVTKGSTFVMRENGIDRTIELPSYDAGMYYTHDSYSFHQDKYRSLLGYMTDMMEDADGGTDNTYSVDMDAGGRPNDDLYFRYLRFKRDSGSYQWGFNFGHSDWTLDKRLLGYPESYGETVYGDNASITSNLGMWGHWQAPVKAHNKRRVRKRSTFSLGLGSNNTWTNSSSMDVRQFKYRFVKGPHVTVDYAIGSSDYAAAGLESGDNHNAFYWLWKHAANGPILFLPDYDYDWGDLGGPSVLTPWEALQWVDQKSLEEFERNVSLIEDAAGEVYDIEFELAIVDGSSRSGNRWNH